jgi:hypothetical protein
MDLSKMLDNSRVKVIGGDVPEGEWEYKMGILWGAFEQIEMSSQLKSVTPQTEESVKKLPEMVGWGLAGAVILGPLGAVAGAMMGGNRKQMCALIELHDNRKFIATMDSKIYQELLAIAIRSKNK